jgi:hypothetical protein
VDNLLLAFWLVLLYNCVRSSLTKTVILENQITEEIQMRNDIVVQAVIYLESSYLLFFALALQHAHKIVDRDIAELELEHWKKTGVIHKYAEDFALDLLSRRLPIGFERKLLGEGDGKKKTRP